ncbi:probable alkaline/neutral invertase B [Tanacetum coccineum]
MDTVEVDVGHKQETGSESLFIGKSVLAACYSILLLVARRQGLLPWVLTAASIKMGRPHIARREIECAELRLGKDGWPKYYDGKSD